MSYQSNLIYEQIQQKINSIIVNLGEQNSDGRIAEDISLALKNLNILNDKIQDEYEKLKASGEWKRFTIAFYGETNAGKSTFIEALRLILKEPKKLESQIKFKELQLKYGITQEAFDEIRQTILSLDEKLAALRDDFRNLVQGHEDDLLKAKSQISELEDVIQNIKSQQNIWQKFLSLFSKLPQEGELNKAEKYLQVLSAKQDTERSQATLVLEQLQQKQVQAESEYQRLQVEAEQLMQFADGQIIGDGRSDFTRNNTSFDFELNGQPFTLIDVPGIEGDEAIVSKPIEEAVRKAHAIFYVTRTARPPQTHEGDIGSKKGTLEKIKQHLDSQTEVWSIYNHPITNPRQLRNPLINDDIQGGLKALDDVLKKELKDQYCQNLVVSARPAYLALTECVIPGSKDADEKRKFSERIGSSNEILQLSQINDFIDKLQTSIIGDYRSKIRKSNLNKANKVLEHALDNLENLIRQFSSSAKEIKVETQSAFSQIDVAMEQFSGNLHAKSSTILRQFKNDVEDKIYHEIDSDLSNDAFKSTLKYIMQSKSERLEADLKIAITEAASEYEQVIKNIVSRSNKHLKDIVSIQNSNFSLNEFDLSVNIDNGVQLFGLISSGVGIVTGVVLLASNPVGWTLSFVGGAIALVGALVGAAKSVFGFFSSSYKQSQQRKEADKALSKAASSINAKIDDMLNTIELEMKQQTKKVQVEMARPLKQYTVVLQTMQQADSELKTVSNTLQKHLI